MSVLNYADQSRSREGLINGKPKESMQTELDRSNSAKDEDDDQGEEENDIPNEAKEWRAHYLKDDLEILYDPVLDFEQEDWVSKQLKEPDGANKDDSHCITCASCFVPIAYAYKAVYLKK